MLDDLTIHPRTRSLIQQSILHPSHAVLLHGKAGTGVGSIAAAMANVYGSRLETVFPKKRQPNGSYEVDEKKGTIIIDDIRQLYDRTRSKFTTPHVVVIDFSGRSMSPGAQNAFLKLLEEPQPMVRFILAVHDMTTVLPTVISRCQKIEVLPATDKQSAALLDTLAVTDPTKRARISFIAQGLAAEITRLATDETYYEARIKTVQDARALLSGDSYSRLVLIQSYKNNREDALQLIDDMAQQLLVSLRKNTARTAIKQLDALIATREHIRGNGNIPLALANVLL